MKAVDRRASTLPREYNEKAKSIDSLYGGVPDGVVGPVQAKLHSFPPLRKWVFGAWGEASEDVHSLVHDLATSRAKITSMYWMGGRDGAGGVKKQRWPSSPGK